MPRCLIALGGNVGAVEETFAQALRRLHDPPRVRVASASSVYRSRAVGDAAGGEFLNAAAAVETELPPLDLLERLQRIENELGRRRATRWGPRTLDLDLVAYGDQVIETPRLCVPHPACWYRRFVLDPVVEIAGDAVHPEKGASFAELRRRLLPRPLRVAVAGGGERTRRAVIGRVQPDFRPAAIEEWPAGASICSSPPAEPALLAWLGPEAAQSGVAEFDALPRMPRLDVSYASEPADFLRHALEAALNESEPAAAGALWPASGA